MNEYIKTYGFTFCVKAENEQEAEKMLDIIARRTIGDAYPDAWSGEVEGLF